MSRIIYDPEEDKFYSETIREIPASRLVIKAVFAMAVDKNLYLASDGTCNWIVRELEAIPFNAHTTLRGDEETVVLVPAHQSNSATLPCQMVFRPYDGQRIWLAINITSDYAMLCSTAASDPNSLYHAGVNNVYPNGSLCTGNAGVPSSNKLVEEGLIPWERAWYSQWTAAPYNMDLRNAYHDTTLVFDPETMENVKLENWKEVVPKLSDREQDRYKELKSILDKVKEVPRVNPL